MKKRVYIALFFIICVIGRQYVLPRAIDLEQVGLLELSSLLTGGSVKQFSLFSVGLAPFLVSGLVASFIKNKKVSKIVDWVIGVGLALGYSYSISVLFNRRYEVLQGNVVKICSLMVLGSILLKLVAEWFNKNTENGESIVILFGFISEIVFSSKRVLEILLFNKILVLYISILIILWFLVNLLLERIKIDRSKLIKIVGTIVSVVAVSLVGLSFVNYGLFETVNARFIFQLFNLPYLVWLYGLVVVLGVGNFLKISK